MKFKDIPQFPHSYYRVNVEIKYLKEHLEHWDRPDMGSPLIMNPEWQRGHVWTLEQKISYMEYFLKGGTTGRDVYFNCSSFQGEYNTPIYCVDGLQRLTTAIEFMDNKIPIFGGHFLSDFEDKINRVNNICFNINVLKVNNKAELLKVYIDMNSGGSPHNPTEIARIEKMMAETDPTETI